MILSLMLPPPLSAFLNGRGGVAALAALAKWRATRRRSGTGRIFGAGKGSHLDIAEDGPKILKRRMHQNSKLLQSQSHWASELLQESNMGWDLNGCTARALSPGPL